MRTGTDEEKRFSLSAAIWLLLHSLRMMRDGLDDREDSSSSKVLKRVLEPKASSLSRPEGMLPAQTMPAPAALSPAAMDETQVHISRGEDGRLKHRNGRFLAFTWLCSRLRTTLFFLFSPAS